MVSVLASSALDHGFEPRLGKTKECKIGMYMYSFSANYAALRRKSKDWLARNRDNVPKWGDMSIRGLLFQLAGTVNIHISVLVKYKANLIIISWKITLFLP